LVNIDKHIEGIIVSSFLEEFSEEINHIFQYLKWNKLTYSDLFERIIIEEQIINIPYRIYFDELKHVNISNLSKLEYRILCCLFTRHSNGKVREKYLRDILNQDSLYTWEIPYVLQLTGEYVVEIIELILMKWELLDNENLYKFICSNRKYVEKTIRRIQSYWNAYYRGYAQENEYVGFIIKESLQSSLINKISSV